MSHIGERFNQYAGYGSGGKRSNEFKTTHRRSYSKKTVSRNQADSTKETKDTFRKHQNSASQTETVNDAEVPVWFINYMVMIQKQVTETVTRNIIDCLDASVDDQESRINHKFQYFALKKRYQILERELKEVRKYNNVPKSKFGRIFCENTSQNSLKKQGISNPRDQKKVPRNESKDAVTNFISPTNNKLKKKSANQDFLNFPTNSILIDKQDHEKENVEQFSQNKKCNGTRFSENKSTVKTVKNQQIKKDKNFSNDALTIERRTTGKCLKDPVENKKSLEVEGKNDENKPELLDKQSSKKKKSRRNKKNKTKKINNNEKNKCSNNQINIEEEKVLKDEKKNHVSDEKISDINKTKDIKNDLIAKNISADEEIENNNSDDYDEEFLNFQDENSQLTFLGLKMHKVFMALRLENLQTLADEIDKFVNLTEEDIKTLIQLCINITKQAPHYSNFLAALMHRIAYLNLENDQCLGEIIVSVCDEDFVENFNDRALFMESLFDRNLIPEPFLIKIYQHYLSEEERISRQENRIVH